MSRIQQTRAVRAGCAGTCGFTLIELALSLLVLGLIAALILALLPQLTDRMRLDETGVETDLVDEAVVGFALANNRLPCPDTNDDGLEGGAGGCEPADEVGRLPFRDLGLPGPALDEARLPLRYAVYRNPGADADLVTLEERFEPALPDALEIRPGFVNGCNETLAVPETWIIYDKPPETTLRVQPISGTFEEDEYIGFLKLEVSNVTAVEPPEPLDAPLDPGDELFCPCGTEDDTDQPFPYPPKCSICPATLDDSKFTVALESQSGFRGHLLTTDTSDEVPITLVREVFGTTVYGFPGGVAPDDPGGVIPDDLAGFAAGDTVTELFNPVDFFGYQPTRPGAPEFDNPGGSPDPIVSENLLTGVTATIDSAEGKTAHVVTVDPAPGGALDLGIDELPATPFSAPDRVYGSSSGAVGTVVSQNTVVTEFDDTTPETVTSSPGGGTATIKAGSDTGSGFIVDGAIQGTINAPTFDSGSGTGTEGDTITGNDSRTEATVVAIISNDSSTPAVFRGSISFIQSVSGATNELDFCQGLRHAIAEAGVTGSADQVHTVNQDTIAINPAYLLVSGGVEDADGDGLDGSFDQLNEISVLRDFESPARLRNDSSTPAAVYDDLVAATPLQKLAERLSCPRNIGVVNAMAAAATVQRNLAEMAFQRNEQALSVIELSYRSLELAKADRNIKAAQVALEVAQALITIYKQIKDPEGIPVFVAAVAAHVAGIAAAIGTLVIAEEAVASAEATYAGACTSQEATAAALTDFITAAQDALALATRADAWGGAR